MSAEKEFPRPSEPGKRDCIQCGRSFRSPDRLRIRRCPRCKKRTDDYEPRMARLDDVSSALRQDEEAGFD